MKDTHTVGQPSPPSISRTLDRKSTRLNSSHANISYAVFCLKKIYTHLRLSQLPNAKRAPLTLPPAGSWLLPLLRVCSSPSDFLASVTLLACVCFLLFDYIS